MKEKDFLAALQKAKVTLDNISGTVINMLETIDKCTPETAGEVLSDAVSVAGFAQLLLIDINDLIKAE